MSSVVYKRNGKELVQPGRVANELLACREYPNHPLFAEGPWHLTPDGRVTSSVDTSSDVTVETSPIGRRIRVAGAFEACHRTQEVTLWDGIERIELVTTLDGYDGHDTLFRVRFPVSVDGGMPIAEVGNSVVGRPFGMPNVDVAETPFTLDHPAYNWFGLGATARVSLVDGGKGSERASAAFGIADIVGTDNAAEDDAIRRLVVALVRQGVTATLSRADGTRYGVLHIDSNLPDVRIAIGRPKENPFVAAVLEAAGAAWKRELDRQLKSRGWARLWVPSAGDRARRDRIPDLRGPRDLPVLIVAGKTADATLAALTELATDLADGVVAVDQPASLDGLAEGVEDYTVAVINHGLPGFNVESDGSLYLSLMRSCSGWPSGVWIDPPRRATPDGGNFQFQHWSHTFRYALAGGAGDWRSAGLVRAGHELNQPLIARALASHGGDLPATASFLTVEPASVVATVAKPSGNPRARMSLAREQATEGLTIRLYESTGRPADARIRSFFPLAGAATTNVTEEASGPARWSDGAVEVALEPFATATVRAKPTVDPALRRAGGTLGPTTEPAQPVFSAYWLHNKGAAPLGYQPVTVAVRPWRLRGTGPFTVPVVVASERTDGPADGTVRVVVPDGWRASPASRDYRLAPGAHVELDVKVEPPAGASPGRYFVAAQLTDDAGQSHEDVVAIDLGGGRDSADGDPRLGSRALAESIERALRAVAVANAAGNGSAGRAIERSTVTFGQESDAGGELVVDVLTGAISLKPGESSELRVRVRNTAASEIRGEAQVISPHETWPIVTPWTQGFAVAGGASTEVAFAVDVPYDFAGGTWWALVKVMAFGRLWYSESVALEVAVGERVRARAAARS
jgi:hypothetical protein